MARRRRGEPAPPPEPYAGALEALNALELRVCYRTVTCDYTAADVVRWLWPAHVIDVLAAAKPYARIPYNQLYTSAVGAFMIRLDTDGLPILCPGATPDPQDTPKAPAIMASLQQVADIHAKFQQARKVVNWFQDNGTLGSTKFYFPSMCSLLPGNHPIQEAGGEIYREPKRPVAEIANDAREAVTTIAMGLITAECEHEASTFKVEVLHDNDTRSQLFCLI